MKFAVILTLSLVSLIASSVAARKPAYVAVATQPGAAPPIPATLTQDLGELSRFIPMKMIMKLITRYLINDAEFQAVVRTLNSYDAFILRMRFRSQPEIMMFNSWVRSQMMLSGGSMELDESIELNIFKMSPYWANSVYGWQGFLTEFMSYYPQELLRAHIDMKIAQNGIFAQFWTRLKALKPVYERVLAYPESQRLLAQLQAVGVDINQLDQFIRTQFDWLNPPAVVPAVGVAGQTVGASVPVTGQAVGTAGQTVGAVVPVTGQSTVQNVPVVG